MNAEPSMRSTVLKSALGGSSVIKPVTKAVAGDAAAKSDKKEADDTTETGKKKEDPGLSQTTTRSRLDQGLRDLMNRALPPGLFGNVPNGLYANCPGFLGSLSGTGARKDDWNGVAEAGINVNSKSKDGHDPAAGVVIGNVDPLYKGSITPDNITVLGATNSGSTAYGTGAGTLIAEEISERIITKGQNLGSILNYLGSNKIFASPTQYQLPRLTSTGSGLKADAYYASTGNKITGTMIILEGEDGNGQYHVGTEEGAHKMANAARALGLNVVFAYNEEQYKQAVLQANKDAEASGGKSLLWVHGEAHGGSNDGGGNHNSNAIGFLSVGGGIDERNLIGHMAYAHETHNNLLFTTGGCHSGAIDANQTFEGLDRSFRTPVTEKRPELVSSPRPKKEPVETATLDRQEQRVPVKDEKEKLKNEEELPA